MIERGRHAEAVRRRLSRNPVVALVGARQAGKTTLARAVAGAANARTTFFDLEWAQDLARLEDPDLALTPLRGLVVLDEIQRRPNLFPTLRVLESLAGRIAYHELPGLSLDEVGMPNRDRLWLRGGFPRAFTARSNAESARWRRDFMRSFLERDVPQLGLGIPAPTLERFWSMLAHYHGQVWNASEFGRSFGVSAGWHV